MDSPGAGHTNGSHIFVNGNAGTPPEPEQPETVDQEAEDAQFAADMAAMAARGRELATELMQINAVRPPDQQAGFSPTIELAATCAALTKLMLALGVVTEQQFVKLKNGELILCMEQAVAAAREVRSSPSGIILPGH